MVAFESEAELYWLQQAAAHGVGHVKKHLLVQRVANRGAPAQLWRYHVAPRVFHLLQVDDHVGRCAIFPVGYNGNFVAGLDTSENHVQH